MGHDAAEVVESAVARIVQDVVRGMTATDHPLDPNAYLVRDLGIDSLGLVTITAKLVAEFGIELPDNVLEDAPYMTVREVVAACTNAVMEAQRAPA